MSTPSGSGSLHPRAAELIRELGLEPHPEGGHFRREFESDQYVQPLDGRPPRRALTSIYYVLASGEHSRWHRVRSDEVWHFYEGDGLDLFWVDAEGRLHHERLGSTQEGSDRRPLGIVPAGCWQAARPIGDFALVGCTVGPGFDFDDFEMGEDAPASLEALKQLAGIPPGLD